jgi:hypothetical protein
VSDAAAELLLAAVCVTDAAEELLLAAELAGGPLISVRYTEPSAQRGASTTGLRLTIGRGLEITGVCLALGR